MEPSAGIRKSRPELRVTGHWAHADWLHRFTPVYGEVIGFPIARLGSVVMGAVTVVALASATSRWTRSRTTGVVAGLVVALFPQLVFVNGYVNADSFTIAAGALLVRALVVWTDRHTSTDTAVLGVAAALVVAGKSTGYFVLAPSVVWVAIVSRRDEAASSNLVLLTIVLASLTLPLLVWNGLRNDGDVLGIAKFHRWLAQWHRPEGRSIAGAGAFFFPTLAQSAFARFRNMDLDLSVTFHRIAGVLLVVGLLHAALGVGRSSDRRSHAAACWLVTSVLLNLAIVVYDAWFVEFHAQGRWVLLSALLLTVVAATAPLSSPASASWPSWWAAGYVGFLAIATAASLFTIATNPCLA